MNKVRMIQAVFEDETRNQLEKMFKPSFSNSTLNKNQYLHHVTLFYNRGAVDLETDSYASEINQWAKEGEDVFVYFKEIVKSDIMGVEALVVTLKNSNGFVLEQPEGKTWHVTLSTEGKPPVMSNDLLAAKHDQSIKPEIQKLNGFKVMAKIVHYK
jgi:hypothetical protein